MTSEAQLPINGNALTSALKYADLHWSVFPVHSIRGGRCTCGRTSCGSPGKHPRTKHGVKGATSDPKLIRSWAKLWKASNVAVATGMPSGLVVIDFDNEDSFAALVSEYGALPHTVEQQTGRGRQLFYSYPDGSTVRNKVGLDGSPGVDVRGEGGYVVVPPSQHSNGRRYGWAGSSDPTTGARLAELPERWLGLLAGKQPPKVTTDDVDQVSQLRDGQRNDGMFRLACSIRAKGLTQPEIEAALLQENTTRCTPPLPEYEVGLIAKSAARYMPGASSSGHFRNTWPEPIDDCAFHGLAGDVVRTISPHSESDPVALLVQFLIAFGNVVGRGPRFFAESDAHFTTLFAVLVGRTSKGRKGTSWNRILGLFEGIDIQWAQDRVLSGLSSGEGLIWHVRDPISNREPVREGKGKSRRSIRYENVIADAGVEDKRCLIIESEFASPLKVMSREGNTLSPVIRQAWDTGTLRTLTKNSPAKATAAHISIIGHVTRDELRRLITATEMANGFANRFLWLCVRRSKCLPEGGSLRDLGAEVRRVSTVVKFARGVEEMSRDPEARSLWARVYPGLSEGRPGLLGAATSRAEAITLRLSCLYALLDRSAVVNAEHLRAALALWSYAAQSARYIFGSALGNPMADEILTALRAHSNGMTRTEIRELFGRHKTSVQIASALNTLAENGHTRAEHEATAGRPIEIWFVCDSACALSAISANSPHAE